MGIDSPELSQTRVADRVAIGGHSVPLDAIIRRYPDTMSKMAEAVGIADRSYILGNSEERRRLLLIHENGNTRYVSQTLPTWIHAALPAEIGDIDAPSPIDQAKFMQDEGKAVKFKLIHYQFNDSLDRTDGMPPPWHSYRESRGSSNPVRWR